ncbi:hypothetical protein SEA_BANQUO_71 [Gordonia phage Banquo]|nr:hypothetical protein SEA_BANQUO_71 [Gordonia phage Banquo]
MRLTLRVLGVQVLEVELAGETDEYVEDDGAAFALGSDGGLAPVGFFAGE